MFQKAEKLAKTGAMTTEIERQKEGDELMALRKIENSKKSSARAKMNPWYLGNNFKLCFVVFSS